MKRSRFTEEPDHCGAAGAGGRGSTVEVCRKRGFKRRDLLAFVNPLRAGRLVGLAEEDGSEPSVPPEASR
jgi:hypothetical protein